MKKDKVVIKRKKDNCENYNECDEEFCSDDSYDEVEYECDEDRSWLFRLSKFEIIQMAIDAAILRKKGEEFTLPMLLDNVWDDLNPFTARQASKEFKIKVCQ